MGMFLVCKEHFPTEDFLVMCKMDVTNISLDQRAIAGVPSAAFKNPLIAVILAVPYICGQSQAACVRLALSPSPFSVCDLDTTV